MSGASSRATSLIPRLLISLISHAISSAHAILWRSAPADASSDAPATSELALGGLVLSSPKEARARMRAERQRAGRVVTCGRGGGRTQAC